MTASDAESLSLDQLLAYADPEDRAAFERCWLGYSETFGAPDCAPPSPRPTRP